MLGWFERHATAVSALSAALTAVLALAALIGVKIQIDGAARIQREQSARDIYREYLNLSVQNPDFAAPDHCALARTPRFAAYQAYVDYLLYTGEQVMSVDPTWHATIVDAMRPHAAFLCDPENGDIHPDEEIAALVQSVRDSECAKIISCP
ncbi:MAG: hypothetical protein WAT70_04390 [Rhizobiaceae bacterium]